MDEQLPAIVELWDPEEAASVRSRLSARQPSRAGAKLDKTQFLQDIRGTYYDIGGNARLSHTANEDPKWFYNRFLAPGILLPQEKQEIDMTVHIHPALQRSALDGEYTDVTGLDQGGDQTPGSAAPGVGSAGGGENPRVENAEGQSLQFALDQKAGRPRSHTEEDE